MVVEWREAILEKKAQSQKRKRDESWDITSLSKEKEPLMDTPAIQSLHAIQKTLQQEIPEVLSRLEHASEPLFLEVSRGFFLPFCTVALGAIGRIRVFLMRIGHQLLDTLEEVKLDFSKQSNLQKIFFSTEELAHLRTQFSEPEPKKPPSRQHRIRNLRSSIGRPGASKRRGKSQGEGNQALGPRDIEKESLSEKDSEKDSYGVDMGMESDGFQGRYSQTVASETGKPESDIGEPVLSPLEDEQEYSAQETSNAPSSLLSSRSTSPVPGQMMKLLSASNESKKKKKRSSEDGGKKRKSEEGRSSRRKRKKKDFFDDLFG